MTGLLTYGSLMHPDEIARYFNRDLMRVPVRVNGFQRSFSVPLATVISGD